MGALYQSEFEGFVEGPNAPKDPIAVAKACFSACFIYIFLFGLCLFQVVVLSIYSLRLSTDYFLFYQVVSASKGRTRRNPIHEAIATLFKK